MRRPWVPIALLLALAGAARADVVFLKAGQRLEGELTPKGNGYEIKNEYGSWVLAKEDILKIVPSFERILIDAETWHKQARALYEEALKIENDPKASNAKLRQGVELLRKAADLYNEALDTYTEPKYGDLSKPVTKLFQEMRLYRDKMHSENAPPSATVKPPAAAPVPTLAPPPPPSTLLDAAALLPKAQAGDVEAMFLLGALLDDQHWMSPDAEKWFRQAADKGHVRAQYRLGCLRLWGKGVKQDYREAQAWFTRSALAGYGASHAALAWLEWKGALGPRSLEKAWDSGAKAFDLLQEADAKGDIDARLWLAWIYREGLGRVQDVAKSLALYREAADQNNARAQTALGMAYRDGLGVPASRVEAERLFLLAARKGYAEAQVSLGELYDVFTGQKVNPAKDFVKALDWYRKAADQGHGRGLYRLGLMHFDAKGTAKEPNEALRLFLAAAARATDDYFKNLLNDLGYIYDQGIGAKRSPPESLKHYQMAADLGSAEAQYNLGSISLEKKNDKDALKWFVLAAKKGHAEAQNNLGTLHATGRAGKKSLPEAEKWFLMAAQQGDPAAIDNLKRLQKERGAAK